MTPAQIAYANAESAPMAIAGPVFSRIERQPSAPASLGTWADDRGPPPSPRRERRVARHVHLGVGAGVGQVERPVRADVRDVPAVGRGLRLSDRAARHEAPDQLDRLPRMRV